jgi:hypothetical protein
MPESVVIPISRIFRIAGIILIKAWVTSFGTTINSQFMGYLTMLMHLGFGNG